MNLHIARETNAALLSTLGYQTFAQAFRELNNPEDFEAYLSSAFSLAAISGELVDARAEFFVAFQGAEPVGYFKLFAGPAPECVSPLPAIELARLYAVESHWGTGVGRALMKQALTLARDKGFAALWLSSWKENQRGNAFYDKWGFDKVGEKTFTIGKDVQEDFVLSRPL